MASSVVTDEIGRFLDDSIYFAFCGIIAKNSKRFHIGRPKANRKPVEKPAGIRHPVTATR